MAKELSRCLTAIQPSATLAIDSKAKALKAAGLDVVEEEPLKLTNPLSEIKDSNRLIITPHLAWASVEARSRCVWEAHENIAAYLRGENRNVVNL